MNERQEAYLSQEITFDNLFSKAFFQYQEAPLPSLSFPLPESPETLKDFFLSKEGEAFKEGTQTLIEAFNLWAKEHGLNAESASTYFKEVFLGYSGSNDEVNVMTLSLYKQGIPQLAGLVELLKHPEISKDYKILVVNNLIEGLAVCAPGTYTNITDAYWQLAAKLSLGIEWMATRRGIATQVALEALKVAEKRLKLRVRGMEIHYVNAVLNYYAPQLVIKSIEDEFIKSCEVKVLEVLFEVFAETIGQSLRAEAIIEHILSEQSLEVLKEYADFDALSRRLEPYGQDACFAISHLFKEPALKNNGEGLTLVWDHNYLLFSTLYHRLRQGEYIKEPKGLIIQRALPGALPLYYLSGRSLRFAWVESGNGRLPLISYSVMEFARGDFLSAILAENKADAQNNNKRKSLRKKISESMDSEEAGSDNSLPLLSFFLSKKVSSEQRLELILGIASLLKLKFKNLEEKGKEEAISSELLGPKSSSSAGLRVSMDELGVEAKEVMDKWLNLIDALNPKQEKFDLILLALPPMVQELYLQRLGFKKLKALIHSGEELFHVLSVLSKEKASLLFKALGVEKLQELIKTGKDLAKVLESLPEPEWDWVFNLFSPKTQVLDLGVEEVVPLFSLIFSHKESKDWDYYSKNLGLKSWQDKITGLPQVLDLFKALPDDKGEFLLKALSLKKLDKISYQRYFLLFSFYEYASLAVFLKDLPIERMRLFLKVFPHELLFKIMDYRRGVFFIFNELSLDKIELLLETMGQPQLNYIFVKGPLRTGFDFSEALACCGLEKTLLLLKRLNPEKTMKMKSLCLCLIGERLETAEPLLSLLGTAGLRAIAKEEDYFFLLFLLPKEVKALMVKLLGFDYVWQRVNFQTILQVLHEYETFPAHIKETFPLQENLEDLLGKDKIFFSSQAEVARKACYFLKTQKQANASWKDLIKKELLDKEDSKTNKIKCQWFGGEEAYIFSIIEWIFFWQTLGNESLESCEFFLNSYELEVLSKKIYAAEGWIFTLPKETCHLVFNRVDEAYHGLFIDTWKYRIDDKKHLKGVDKIPEKMAKKLLSSWPVSHLPTFIQDESMFWIAFNLLERQDKILLIHSLDDARLAKLLLKEKSLDETLACIEKNYDKASQEVMLLALVKALRGKHCSEEASFAVRLRFWQTPMTEKQKSIQKQAYDQLEKAINADLEVNADLEAQPDSGMKYFDALAKDPNLRTVIDAGHQGDLTKLTHAFELLHSPVHQDSKDLAFI